MKTIIIYLFIAIFLAGVPNGFAQWQPNMRLTNDSAHTFTCFNNARGVSASGNYVHAVWFDERNGLSNREIYYKRSTDGGSTWETDIRMTNSTGASEVPCIAANGSFVFVAWKDSRTGNEEIYFKRSTDNGNTWSADTNLSNTPLFSVAPSITTAGKDIFISWYDVVGSNYDVFFKRSTTGGMTWEDNVRLTTDPSFQLVSSISASDTLVHTIWEDSRSGNKIYYRGSTDRGVTWGSEIILSPGTSSAVQPCITSSGLNVHAVWQDSRLGDPQIYYVKSTDAGFTWGPEIRLTSTSGDSWYPSLWANDQKLHLIWSEITNNIIEIHYKYSTNGGPDWSVDIPLTNHFYGGGQRASIGGSGPGVHVIWLDTRDSVYEELYYKGNPTGTTAINTISSEIPEGYNLSQNYPNPFNPMTKIKFDIPKAFNTKLAVYDILGKEVAVLVNDNLKPGSYEVDFSAADLPSGTYFYRLITEGFSETKKMTLIK
jgi:hypothetical protein